MKPVFKINYSCKFTKLLYLNGKLFSFFMLKKSNEVVEFDNLEQAFMEEFF